MTAGPRHSVLRTTAVAVGIAMCGALIPAGGAGAATASPEASLPGPQWGVAQPSQQTLSPLRATQLESSTTSSSTAAAATAGWTLHGAGWGHGIGMSQYGAWEMAKAGYSASGILQHYYTGTTYDAVTDNQVVKVNLVHRASTVTLVTVAKDSGVAAGPLTVANGTQTMVAPAGTTITVVRSGASVKATCTGCTGTSPGSLTAAVVTATWNDGKTLLDVNGTRYESQRVAVTPTRKTGVTTTTLEAVNSVRVHDQYLFFLREMPWSWSPAALQAQAAAARGYALRSLSALKSDGSGYACDCNLFDTTLDQVYGGFPTGVDRTTYWPLWKQAVQALGAGNTTQGYVARYNGAIIQALYSSSSGGRTENNEDVWQGSTPLPYLRGVADPWSLKPSNPNAAWVQTTVGSSMASRFGLSDVVRLDLRDRTVNGGVHNATAYDSSGNAKTITGDSFRSIATTSAAPYGMLKSTMVRHLTGRLAGADRYATATAVASRIPVSATSAVFAAADSTVPYDVSVAGPLAATLGGPLLLVQQSKLPSATVAELNRRGSALKTAYIIGGTGVVSDTVAGQLRNRGLTVVRLSGSDRYGTAAAVATKIHSMRSTPSVVIAGGTGLPDALSASGPAAALREPILLTQSDRLTTVTKNALTAIGATATRIVGGTPVVGSTVQSQLAAGGFNPIRLAGADRFGTGTAVAAFYRPRMPVTSEVALTSGADASLVDSLVAGTLQRLVVLTPKWTLSESSATTLQSTPRLETVTAVGSTGALAGSTLTAAANS